MKYPTEHQIIELVEKRIQEASELGWYWGDLYEEEFKDVALHVWKFIKEHIVDEV